MRRGVALRAPSLRGLRSETQRRRRGCPSHRLRSPAETQSLAEVQVADAANATLAVLTFFVLLANLHLARSTKRTAEAAERQAAAGSSQAQAARAQAEAATEQIRVAADQVRAAERHVDIAERALALQTQPVLIDEPLNLAVEERYDFPEGATTLHPGGIVVATFAEGRRGRLSFPVRNMGRGPAHIVGVGVRLSSREGRRVTGPACNEITRDVVPVGESARLNFSFGQEDLGPRWEGWEFTTGSYGNFSILVRYRDLGGLRDLVTHFVLARRPGSHYGWEVRQVLMHTAAEVEEEERRYAEQHP
jgi:hypothetical protein